MKWLWGIAWRNRTCSCCSLAAVWSVFGRWADTVEGHRGYKGSETVMRCDSQDSRCDPELRGLADGGASHTDSPSHLSSSFPALPEAELAFTVSDEKLSLVLGSLRGFGGGCLREFGQPSSSPPPTECRDCERTEKPVPQGWGRRSWGAGIVMKPMRKCFPGYPPSIPLATSSPILPRQGENELITPPSGIYNGFRYDTEHA